jgi:hypothetical protein
VSVIIIFFKILCVFIVSSLTLACDSPDPKLWPPDKSTAINIYVSCDGFHSSVILPQNSRKLPFVSYAYFEKAWWLSDRRGCFGEIRAMLLPSSGVLQKMEMAEKPQRHNGLKVWTFKVSPQSLEKMRQEIEGLKANKHPVRTYQKSHVSYYRSAQSYHVFNTCNSFTADVLVTGGLPLHSWFVISNDEIMERLDSISTWEEKVLK